MQPALAVLPMLALLAGEWPAWRQDPAADARWSGRVYPVTGVVEAADSLPALEVLREDSEAGERLAVQLLRVAVDESRTERVLYLGALILRPGDEMCHLGYRVPGRRMTLGDALARIGREWEGPAAAGVGFVAETVVLGEPDGFGAVLCCPPNLEDRFGARMVSITTTGANLSCEMSTARGGVPTLECNDEEGSGGRAACWRCEETWGTGACRAILETGFIPKDDAP